MPDTPSASVPSSPARSSSDGFRFSDLLRFEKMLTPRLAKLGFYVFSILAVGLGLILTIDGMNARFGGGMRVVAGLSTALIGPFLIRVACEQIIVIFGIYERLGQIRDQGQDG